eukprot:2362057-Pleurochrysis_carterae.AAC.2
MRETAHQLIDHLDQFSACVLEAAPASHVRPHCAAHALVAMFSGFVYCYIYFFLIWSPCPIGMPGRERLA